MATLTAFSTADSGSVLSSDSVYATANTGASLQVSTLFTSLRNSLDAPTYELQQAFLAFDTSALGGGATISSVALSIWGIADASLDDGSWTVEARSFDWSSGGLTEADWRTAAQLAALTRVATFSITATGDWVSGAYNTFTEDGSNFQSAINQIGTTYLVLHHSGQGSAPTGSNQVVGESQEALGTDNDPKLVITYTLPGSAGGGPQTSGIRRASWVSAWRGWGVRA